ncbi:MAG: hypothetical protein LBK82_03795 [Planctomycetaceae bacterium]|nr:hypothetical protein [Planctomycetaceae bacterium]
MFPLTSQIKPKVDGFSKFKKRQTKLLHRQFLPNKVDNEKVGDLSLKGRVGVSRLCPCFRLGNRIPKQLTITNCDR